jgi:hypothetical protein
VDGGILAFAHDPSGILSDVSSPTELHPGAAVLNYAVAAVLLAALLLGLGRFVLRSGAPAELPPAAEVDGDEEEPR